MARSGVIGRAERAGHQLLRRLDQRSVAPAMRDRWLPAPADADAVFLDRLHRDRTEIVPWLASLAPLDGARILEIGCGRGASTFALAEQGASVLGVDVNAQAMGVARARLAAGGLEAELVELNAADLDQLAADGPFDLVIFWASLEHMLVAERLDALRHARARLAPGAPLVVIETPNRLWPHDSHTAWMPFFHWLPDELAFHVLDDSPRDAVRGKLTDPATEMVDFARLGRGMSFHEFERALGRVSVRSCLQVDRRRSSPLRSAAWWASSAGRTARCLRRFDPDRDPAWFQPFLYLAIDIPSAPT